jgi:hypothetical protein
MCCNLRLNLVLNTSVLITCNTLNFVCGDQNFLLISWYVFATICRILECMCVLVCGNVQVLWFLPAMLDA